MTGLPYHRISVHTTYTGGGYGRRVDVDYVAEAVELSLKLKRPVKVIWTREEDMRRDCYRPASLNQVEAGLDANGRILWWKHRIVGPDHMGYMIAAPGSVHDSVLGAACSSQCPGLVGAPAVASGRPGKKGGRRGPAVHV